MVGNYYRLTAVLVAILFSGGGVEGQVAAPGPSPDCMTYLLNASDCLTYVSEGSTLKKPEKGCCGELAGLVDSNPICLCYLLSSNNTFGLQFDVKKALNLPSICSVTTPPVSLCSEIGIPVGAPTSTSSDEGMMGPSPSSSESTTQLSPSSSSSSSYTSPGMGSAPSGSSSSGCGSSTMAPSALLFLVTLPFAFAATMAFSF